MLPGVNWVEDAYKAARNADLVVILTEWNEFRGLDLKRMAKHMATRRMADLRNIYSNKDAKRAGFDAYISIGRAPLEPSKSGDA
jgi:UDPglucose 6-dehydrogenase